MKQVKLFTALLFVILLANTVAASDLPLVLSEDFSNGEVGGLPAGWIIATRGSTPDTPILSDDVSRSGDMALKLSREPENSHITNGVVISFGSLTERAVISFWFYAVDYDRSLVLGFAGQSQGTNLFGASTGGFLVLRNRAVQAYDTAFKDVGLYEPEKWHKVTIDVDIRSGTYDVYVDDDATPGNLEPIRFRNPDVADIAAIGIGFQAATATQGLQPVYIDDLEVRGR